MSTERQTKSNPDSICDFSSIFRKINTELFHSRGLSFKFYSTSCATGGFVMNSNLELRGRVWFRLVCCFNSELRRGEARRERELWELLTFPSQLFARSARSVQSHSIFINVLSKKTRKAFNYQSQTKPPKSVKKSIRFTSTHPHAYHQMLDIKVNEKSFTIKIHKILWTLFVHWKASANGGEKAGKLTFKILGGKIC